MKKELGGGGVVGEGRDNLTTPCGVLCALLGSKRETCNNLSAFYKSIIHNRIALPSLLQANTICWNLLKQN